MSGVRVPLSPSPSPLPGPASPSWGPLALPASLHPCLPVFSLLVSAGASFPTPRPPSCRSLPAFARLVAPSLLPSLRFPVAGCIRMGREVQSLRAPGLGSSGKGGVKRTLGPGTGKVVGKGDYDSKFWRRKWACPRVWETKELRALKYGRVRSLGQKVNIIDECRDARERLRVPSRRSEMQSKGAGTSKF